MASFELSRGGSVADVARESHLGRYLPLYLAGIAGGAGLGLAVTFVTQGSEADTPRIAPIVAPYSPPLVRVPAPAIEVAPAAPAGVENGPVPATDLDALTALEEDFLAGLYDRAPIAAAPPVEPAAPAPVQAPAAPAATAPPAPIAPVAAPPVPVAPAAAPPAEEAPPAAAPAPAKPNFYVPEPRAGGITALEQRLLDGINAERAAAGLAPYAYDGGLTRIARVRVQQLVDQGYFGHTDPYGYSMYVELLAHFGYTSYAWAGENLAMNNYSVEESPERAVAALMRSPTHKANLLAGDFFRIGIGELTTPDGRHFYAMIFLG